MRFLRRLRASCLLLPLLLLACDYTTPPDERKLRSIEKMFILWARRVVVRPGDTLSLRLIALDSAGRVVEGIRPTWSSRNPDIATIDANGLLAAHAAGVATIAATAGTHAATLAITIEERALGAGPVVLYPDTIVSMQGMTARLASEAEPPDNSRILRGSAIELRFERLGFTGGPVESLGRLEYSYKGLLPAGVVASQLQLLRRVGTEWSLLPAQQLDTAAMVVRATLPLPNPVDSGITVALYTPQGVAVFPFRLEYTGQGHVRGTVTVASAPPITQGYALLDGRRGELTVTGRNGPYTTFAFELPAAGAPRAAPVTIFVMNAAGLTATAMLPLPNRAPQLRVESPAVGEVTLDGRVHVRATCSDPDGEPCTSFVVRSAGSGSVLWQGRDSVDAEVALSASGFLQFSAGDSAGASTFAARQVIVFSGAGLAQVARLPGRVLDFNGTEVVHVVNTEAYDGSRDGEATLRYRSSVNGLDQEVTKAGSIGTARLFAPGALWYSVWVPSTGGGPQHWDLYEWRNGVNTLLDRNMDHSDPAVEAPFILWTRPEGGDTVLVRRNMIARSQVVIARNLPPWRGGFSLHYVAPTGEVSFINRNVKAGDAGLYLSDGLTTQRLDSGLYSYSRTDGLTVVGSKGNGFGPDSVFIFTGLQRDLLARSPVRPVNLLGLTVFSPSPLSPFELWVRSASGALAARGFSSAGMAIEYVTREGHAIVRSGSAYTYVPRSGGARAVPPGFFAQRNGVFYLFGGSAILRIE